MKMRARHVSPVSLLAVSALVLGFTLVTIGCGSGSNSVPGSQLTPPSGSQPASGSSGGGGAGSGAQEGEAEPVEVEAAALEERAEAEECLVEQAVGLRPLLWLT